MTTYSADDLRQMLELHQRWLLGEDGGQRVDLCGADLSEAYLSGADLSESYLSGADLRGADLSGADLRGADLRGAYLRGAYLSGADLCSADLSGADLRGAHLGGAYLSGAHLGGADLCSADISGADLRGAHLGGAYLRDQTLRYASCSWTAHGECGRTLTGIAMYESGVMRLQLSCGCFSGTAQELRDYIARGDERYQASRTTALEFVLARMAEMGVAL